MRRAPFTERNPVTIAVAGAAVVLVLFALVFNFDRLPIVGEGPEYAADFTDASGLQTGEDVRVAGIKVGTVSGIDLDGAQVRVSFHSKGVSFGTDTRASIEIQTLLGQHYLSLLPAGHGQLRAGATIPLDHTSTPLNIVPAFQQLTGTVDDIDTKQVAQAFDTLSAALGGTAPEVRQTLAGLSALSASVSSRDDQIQELFRKAHNVSGVLASRDQQIGQLLTDTNSVLDLLNRRRDTIRQIITGTDALAGQLTGLVRDNRAQLQPTLDKLHSVVEVLQRNDQNLDALIGQVTVYGREFTNVGGTGRWFDGTIKLPRGFALCDTTSKTPLSQVLDPVLSQQNSAATGNGAPCLPLGPGVNSAPGNASGGGR